MARIEQSDLAARAAVSVDTIKRLERTVGPVSANVATVNAVVSALEAAGIEFTNGGQPGVRMRIKLIDMTGRNARLRQRIEALLAGADKKAREEVESIALRQPPAATSESEEFLQDVFENLRQRAQTLIRLGFAKSEDFAGLF